MKTKEDIIYGAQLLKKLNNIEMEVILDWMQEYAKEFITAIEKAREVLALHGNIVSLENWNQLNSILNNRELIEEIEKSKVL